MLTFGLNVGVLLYNFVLKTIVLYEEYGTQHYAIRVYCTSNYE